MTLSRRDKYSLIAFMAVLAAFGAFMLDRPGGIASAGTESEEPSLAVIEPASESTISEQPEAVREQLELVTDGVAARSPTEPVEVTGIGDTVIPGEGKVSVAQVGEEVCAFQVYEIGSCADEAEIAMGRIFTATPAGCEHYDVLGIVGNDIESILVSPEGESGYRLDVVENIYLGTFAAVQTAITGLDASGNTALTNLLPLGEYLEQNEACQQRTG
ncbi:MAG: hypothetical protein QG596_57 [Actinomycetota bacterium]|nr:hypothetical protein [Actinomycetota bacterium]